MMMQNTSRHKRKLITQTSREMLSIMSDHYPYKLSLCAFQSLPWVVRTAMNVAWPFADAALKENVKFDKNLVKDGDVDRAVLMKPLGGDLDVSTTFLAALRLRDVL